MRCMGSALLVFTTACATLTPGAAHADPAVIDCVYTTIELERSACSALAAGGSSCSYGGIDIAIGTLTAEVERTFTGDISYWWSAPAQVRVNGNCDHQTISRATYTDTPSNGMGRTLSSPTYRAQESGQVTVSQAPKWDVLYYGVTGAYVRSVRGTLSMVLEGSFIWNGYEYRMGRCKRKTWHFDTTPTGPNFQQTTVEENVGCPRSV